jgi:catechol 2,3-dioxygenase-like lactoylglutathione lyase family enzyme
MDQVNTIGPDGELSAQLVVEVMVTSLSRSLAFYEALGFSTERRSASFASLRWGDNYFFLAEQPNLPAVPPGSASRVNLRVMVPSVDVVWTRIRALGMLIEEEIGDRVYGLRDFTIIDPDGFGLRFAQRTC